MSERQSLRLKIPSEKLALIQQSMDGVKKKRKTRVNWKAGEKEAMVAFREKYSEMPMKEFQQVSSLLSFFSFLFVHLLFTLQTT
jgi:hypothetical protein